MGLLFVGEGLVRIMVGGLTGRKGKEDKGKWKGGKVSNLVGGWIGAESDVAVDSEGLRDG